MNYQASIFLEIILKLIIAGGLIFYTNKKAKALGTQLEFKDFKLISIITFSILLAISLAEATTFITNIFK